MWRRFATALALAASTAQAQHTEARFSACHITFQYPKDWTVAPDTMSGAPCSFVLRPPEWRQKLIAHDSVDYYSVSINVVSKAFGTDIHPFERRGRRYVIGGHAGDTSPARTIGRNGWRGLEGDAPRACYRENGPYAAFCEMPEALVGTSRRTVYVEALPQSADVFDRILATLRIR